MSSPFVAEIRIFAGNFAPAGWAMCNGQLLPISQNTALFSLLGTTYGGDGKSTFALPDLQGAFPMHIGRNQPGPGLSFHDLGERGGEEQVTLLQSEMPAHTHTGSAASSGSGHADPTNAVFASGQRGRPPAYGAGTVTVPMSPQAVSITGGSQPHNNLQPFLVVSYIIALRGIYPARN